MSDTKTVAHEVEDKLVIQTYQDVEPHLKICERERRVDREHRTAFGKRGELRRTMSVPNNIMMKVCQDLGIQPGDMFNPEFSRRIWAELKKPEYKYFRTTNDKRI